MFLAVLPLPWTLISSLSDQNVPSSSASSRPSTSKRKRRLPSPALIGVMVLIALGVILFLLLFRLDTKTVLGTSLFASFFRYLGGSVGYLTAGQINPVAFTYGYDRLRFPKPVFIGDTIHVRSKIMEFGGYFV